MSADLLYSTDHAWLRLDDDGAATVGVSEYAQAELGDVVYIEAPSVGRDIVAGEEVAQIESVKTTAEFKSPATGQVLAVNEEALEKPELLNESPLEDGWLYRMRIDDEADLEVLMDDEAYREYLDSL